jgi:RNA polymerase sigma factor (sigma-70 family)
VLAEPLDRAALEQSCRRLERRLGTLILIVQQMSKVRCTLVYPDRAKRRYLRKLEVPGLPDAHRLTAQALAALSAVDPGSGEEQGPLDVLDRVEAFFPGEMPRDWWAGNWPWEGNGHRDPELRWLRGYFQSISQFPLLTARQESGVDLLGTEDTLPDAPLSAARWRLVTHNLRWVVAVARRYRGSGLDLEDLIQEGTLGLVKAAAYFDPARGYRFLTYATWWIRQAIRQAIAERGRLIRLPVYVQNILVDLHRSREFLRTSLGREASISELAHQTGLTPQDTGRFLLVLDGTIHLIEEVSETLEDRSFSGWDRAVAKDLVASIDRLLEGLRPREAEILRLRFGLNGGRRYTLEEIGNRYGVSRARIQQIEAATLRKLRQPDRLVVLQPFAAEHIGLTVPSPHESGPPLHGEAGTTCTSARPVKRRRRGRPRPSQAQAGCDESKRRPIRLFYRKPPR